MLTQDIQLEVLWPPVIVSCTMAGDIGRPTMERAFTHDLLISNIPRQDSRGREEFEEKRGGGGVKGSLHCLSRRENA